MLLAILGFVCGYGACLGLDALVARRGRLRRLRSDTARQRRLGASLGALRGAWPDPAGVRPLRGHDPRLGLHTYTPDVHTAERQRWVDELQRELALISWRNE